MKTVNPDKKKVVNQWRSDPWGCGIYHGSMTSLIVNLINLLHCCYRNWAGLNDEMDVILFSYDLKKMVQSKVPLAMMPEQGKCWSVYIACTSGLALYFSFALPES